MTEQTTTTAATEQIAVTEPPINPAAPETPAATPPARPAPVAAPVVTVAPAPAAAPATPADPAASGDAERLRAEYAEIAAVAAQAVRLGITVDAADAMERGVAPEALRRSVLDALASRAEASAVVSAAPLSTGAAPAASPIVRRARERAAAARE